MKKNKQPMKNELGRNVTRPEVVKDNGQFIRYRPGKRNQKQSDKPELFTDFK